MCHVGRQRVFFVASLSGCNHYIIYFSWFSSSSELIWVLSPAPLFHHWSLGVMYYSKMILNSHSHTKEKNLLKVFVCGCETKNMYNHVKLNTCSQGQSLNTTTEWHMAVSLRCHLIDTQWRMSASPAARKVSWQTGHVRRQSWCQLAERCSTCPLLWLTATPN